MIVLQDLDKPQAPQSPVTVFYASASHPTMTNLNDNDLPPAYEEGLISTINTDMREKDTPNTAQNEDAGRETADRGALGDYPAAFSRSMPSFVTSRNSEAHSSAPFQPLIHHSKSNCLEDGFYPVPPPTDIQPHPFTVRDVTEHDWTKFLNDLRLSARVTDGQKSTNSPHESNQRLNFFQSLGATIRSISANSPGKQAELDSRGPGSLVDLWNRNFFHHRGLEVVLARGSRRLSGDRSKIPPDFKPNTWPIPSTPPIPRIPSVPPVPTTAPHGIPPPAIPPMPHCQMPRIPHVPAGPEILLASNGQHNGPSTGGIYTTGDQRSRSSVSLSTISSESSVSSSEHEYPQHYALSPGTHIASREQRRAEKRARRLERRIKRKESRATRKQARCARKLAKLEARMGHGVGGSTRVPEVRNGGSTNPSEVLQGTIEMLRGIAIGSNDDGYYRLIITDYNV